MAFYYGYDMFGGLMGIIMMPIQLMMMMFMMMMMMQLLPRMIDMITYILSHFPFGGGAGGQQGSSGV